MKLLNQEHKIIPTQETIQEFSISDLTPNTLYKISLKEVGLHETDWLDVDVRTRQPAQVQIFIILLLS